MSTMAAPSLSLARLAPGSAQPALKRTGALSSRLGVPPPALGQQLSRPSLTCPSLTNRRNHGVAQPRASSEAATAEASVEPTFPRLKEFMKDLEEVGRVRIIVNTGMGVLESVTTLEGLFYTPYGGKGEYGNIMKSADNVDFHLLLPEVAKVQLVTAPSRAGDFSMHTARFYDKTGNNGASIFVMWKPGTKGDYDPGQVDAFQRLVDKYGEEVVF